MSPVVGMILVLAISVVGIAAILYWGLPAIDEMKANVEFRSAQTQFEELDATLKELVAGTTEKTAKRWQPTVSRGSITVYNNTEAWLFAVEPYNATSVAKHDFAWGGLADGDNTFHVHANNTTAWVKVEAYIVTGTSTSTALVVNNADSATQMTGASLPAWGADTSKQFWVFTTGGAPQRLENATFKFRIFSGSSLVAEAWYANTGRIEFQLEAGLGGKSVVENNGAVITGANGGYAIVNSPSVPPPSDAGGVHRVFARSLLVGGNTSLAGTDTFDVLISLYATATLASYDCAQTTYSDCVAAVKIFNYGAYRAPWHAYLTNANKGYSYVEESKTVGGATVPYLEDRKTAMGFTLLQSSLRLSGG